MAEKPQNNNTSNGEVGIIELLNYFKNGFHSIFNWFKKVFSILFNLFIQFLILIKNNYIFIGSMVLLFVGLFFVLKKTNLLKSYDYEMIVRPNYNSTETLFSQVQSIGDMIGSDEADSFESSLIKIEIEPLINMQSTIDAYYNVIDNDFVSANGFNQQNDRDTIFFREVPINEFVNEIKPTDYRNFKISIKSKVPLKKETIYENITDPIENTPSFAELRNNFLKELSFQRINDEKSINIIDTLLISRTNEESISSQKSINFENGNVKLLEDELLTQKEKLLSKIKSISLQQSEFAKVMMVISEPKLSQMKGKITKKVTAFAFYGFVFAILIMLFRRFIKYLDSYSS